MPTMFEHGKKTGKTNIRWNRALCAPPWRLFYLGVLVAACGCSIASPSKSLGSGSQGLSKKNGARVDSGPESRFTTRNLPAELLEACPDAKFEVKSVTLCRQRGCVGGFFLRTFPTNAWPHGEYRFIVDVDGQVVTCTGSLPLPTCEDQGISCDSTRVGIGESGCALPLENHAFSNIAFEGYPRAVRIEVLYNDASAARAYYEPSYRYSQPNGPGCEPVCCSASASFTLDFSTVAP